MKSRNFKRTGLVLMLAGLAGLAMTVVGVLQFFNARFTNSASALAEGISSSVLPA